MKTSSDAKIRQLYEDSADSYDKMMDTEIDLPVYADILGRLAQRLDDITGALIDTSCGSGHMLRRYHQHFDPDRPLIGIDLSPHMTALAHSKLGPIAKLITGDMRDLETIKANSVAAVLSFFALHHIEAAAVSLALKEWHRVLCPGGQLVVATWEGTGPIDYGGAFDIVALRYSKDQLTAWAQEAGFFLDRCAVAPVEEMPMEAIYLEATKHA